jgi:hypothetical protein
VIRTFVKSSHSVDCAGFAASALKGQESYI